MITVICIFFFIGVVLTGSDGPYFPWPNFAGLALVSLYGLLATKRG